MNPQHVGVLSTLVFFIHKTQNYLNIVKPKLDAKGVNPKSHFLVLVFHESHSILSMRLRMENYTKYDI